MDTVFFWLSKLVFALLSPDNLLVVLALLALGCYLTGKERLARLCTGSCFAGLLLFGFLPVGEWMAAPLENRYESSPPLPQSLDGIVVLGGAMATTRSELWGMNEVNGSAERINAFIRLGQIYPEARLLFTGGSGSLLNPEHREADAVARLIADLGFDSQRIVFERESRNTHENVVNSKSLLGPQSSERWLLITSATHMPRSVGIFCKQEWPVIPYPVDHLGEPEPRLRFKFNLAENLGVLRVASKEWLGLVAYRMTGKTAEFLPSRDSRCIYGQGG